MVQCLGLSVPGVTLRVMDLEVIRLIQGGGAIEIESIEALSRGDSGCD